MLTNTNLVTIQGNLIKNAEINDQIGLLNFSIAVDNAGSEKDSDSKAGFFDVKMWVRDNDYTAVSTVEAVKKYHTDGKLVKGAKVSIIGRITQERWKDDSGKTNSRTYIVAENINVLWTADTKTQPKAAEAGGTATAGSDFMESF